MLLFLTVTEFCTQQTEIWRFFVVAVYKRRACAFNVGQRKPAERLPCFSQVIKIDCCWTFLGLPHVRPAC